MGLLYCFTLGWGLKGGNWVWDYCTVSLWGRIWVVSGVVSRDWESGGGILVLIYSKVVFK